MSLVAVARGRPPLTSSGTSAITLGAGGARASTSAAAGNGGTPWTRARRQARHREAEGAGIGRRCADDVEAVLRVEDTPRPVRLVWPASVPDAVCTLFHVDVRVQQHPSAVFPFFAFGRGATTRG